MNDGLKPALARCLDAVRTELPLEELPDSLAEIERIKALAWARLQAPVLAPSDQLLDVNEAARRLGISKTRLYRHQHSTLSPATTGDESFFRPWASMPISS